AQNSSARYFGRPDADHLELDPTATSLSGYTAQLQIRRQAGRHWRGDAAVSVASPGYEVNDLGFQARADQIGANGQILYLENRPGSFFRSYRMNAVGIHNVNLAGEHIGSVVTLGWNWQHLSYFGGFIALQHGFESLDDRLTRGGPMALRPADNRVLVTLSSDARKPVTAGTQMFYMRDDGGQETRFVNATLGLKTSPRWNLTLGPQYSRTLLPAQYLTSVADPLAPSIFGRRYVFAEMDQTTVSLETRLNFTFNPRLSLEMYAQPFVTSAEFTDYKELTVPRSFDFAVYGRERGTIERSETGAFRIDPDADGPAPAFTVGQRFGQSDFNLRSLRGNAVLRWEWRPGSTLFLAWQQIRSDLEGVGNFNLGRDRAALFAAKPDNVFLIKVNYWLNP
ncbi:MAG TPA: DUF5916 domain-containing protein, partial [Longimicrobiaceae bacterium]|nr:DUF5916 domain-containing protein [Longimicrobiaceae bacterium]